MPGKGRLPKQEQSRARDTARRRAPQIVVSNDDVLRGPELPPHPGEGWHERTVAFYDTLRRSPMAQSWIETDWDFVAETALIHSAMWRGEYKLAAEVRLRTAKLGCTPEDRLRLRIQITEPDEVQGVPGITDDRRRRLLRSIASTD